MIEQLITDKTFLLIAMRNYDNPQCASLGEFEEDLKRFMYLKKLLARYAENGELKERLILNHITVLHNLFGVAVIEMLFFKIEQQHWNVLATFLDYLGLLPESVPELHVNTADLVLDTTIISKLKEL